MFNKSMLDYERGKLIFLEDRLDALLSQNPDPTKVNILELSITMTKLNIEHLEEDL